MRTNWSLCLKSSTNAAAFSWESSYTLFSAQPALLHSTLYTLFPLHTFLPTYSPLSLSLLLGTLLSRSVLWPTHLSCCEIVYEYVYVILSESTSGCRCRRGVLRRAGMRVGTSSSISSASHLIYAPSSKDILPLISNKRQQQQHQFARHSLAAAVCECVRVCVCASVCAGVCVADRCTASKQVTAAVPAQRACLPGWSFLS